MARALHKLCRNSGKQVGKDVRIVRRDLLNFSRRRALVIHRSATMRVLFKKALCASFVASRANQFCAEQHLLDRLY